MPDHAADAPPEPEPRPRRWFGRAAAPAGTTSGRLARWAGAPGSPRRLVALIAAVALLLGLLAAAGIGETSAAQPALDGGAWLGSANGSLVHANGVSARIDWTTAIAGGAYRVVQNGTGGFIDQGTGRFLTIDGSGMKVGNATQIDGADVEIVSSGARSFVVYRADGIVQEVNPTTLDAVGDAVDLGGPIGSAGVDAQGILYAALNDARQIAVVKNRRLESLIGDGSDAGAQLVTVGTSVAAVDTTAGDVLLLHDGVARRSIALGLPSGTELALPASESGSTLWITDVTHRQLVGLGTDGSRSQTVPLPTTIATPGAPQPAGDQVYLFDRATGALATIDTTTASARTQKLVRPNADAEFFGKDGLVYVNDFGGNTAFVANDLGVVSPLVKYAVNKPLPQPGPATNKPQVKKLAPQVKKKVPARIRRIPQIHPRPKPKPKPKPKPPPKPKPTTTTTSTTTDPSSSSTTTTGDPNSTTTTTDPNSTTTTTTDPNSTTTTTTDPNSTTTTTTTDPNSTTTSPTGPGP